MLVRQYLAQRLGVLDVVVEPLPHDVFHREAALVGEVILAQQVHHFLDVIGILYGHELAALVFNGIVNAHGDVHAGGLAQHFEGVFHSHCRHRDALGAPCQSPGSGEYLNHLEHVVEVVERLSHAHEHDIGELLGLWHAQHLVDDLIGGEVAMESLPARHAEVAVHAASLLRRDAQCGAVILGDVDALNGLVATGVEEIFHCSVFARLRTLGTVESHTVLIGKQFFVGLGDVAHLVKGCHALGIDPLGELCGYKLGHSQSCCHFTQFVQVHAC